MKAATYQGVGEVKVMEVPKPAIKRPDEVLVRITLNAICGSDLHAYHGRIPMSEGELLGHEFVGIVEEAGSAVNRFKTGDRVVTSFFIACGHCALCRKGNFNECVSLETFGFGAVLGNLGGGQSEYVVVPLADSSMELIPDEVSDEQAVFVGDILSTGLFAAERAEIRYGDTVAIIGAGPVGLMATMCAQLFGPARVFIVDVVDSRLELAQELGAIPINSSKLNPIEAILERTGGVGADSSIEAVGATATVDMAIRCVRGGGTVSVVGVPAEFTADFPYYLFWEKALTFRSGRCNVQRYMKPLLDLIAAGRLHPEKIISHRMKLTEAAEAYKMFDAREATKIVLTP